MCATEIEIASSHSIYLFVRFTEKDTVIAIVFGVFCLFFVYFFSLLLFL